MVETHRLWEINFVQQNYMRKQILCIIYLVIHDKEKHFLKKLRARRRGGWEGEK